MESYQYFANFLLSLLDQKNIVEKDMASTGGNVPFELWNRRKISHSEPRALRNRSDHIDIPSTQHRSSKGSRTTHQSTKARIRKLIPISRVHNRMDKLTLTRQFWIQLGIFFGGYREEIGM